MATNAANPSTNGSNGVASPPSSAAASTGSLGVASGAAAKKPSVYCATVDDILKLSLAGNSSIIDSATNGIIPIVDDDFRNALALNHPLFIPAPDLALRLEAAFTSGSALPPAASLTQPLPAAHGHGHDKKDKDNRRSQSATQIDNSSIVADAAIAVSVRTNVIQLMRAWVEMAYGDVAILRRDGIPRVKTFLKTVLEDEDKNDAIPSSSRHHTSAASLFMTPSSSNGNGNGGLGGLGHTGGMSSLTGTAASSKFTMVSPPALMAIDNAADILSEERMKLRALTRFADDAYEAKKTTLNCTTVTNGNNIPITLEIWLDNYYSSIVTDGSRLPKEQASPFGSPPVTPTGSGPSLANGSHANGNGSAAKLATNPISSPLGLSRQLPGLSSAIVDEVLFSAKPSVIAAQMTLCDTAILLSLTPREFIRKEWTRKDTCATRAANILAMIELFNRRSYWSACSVMMTDDSLLRPRILAALIEVAHELKRHNNFFGCYSILTGISMSSLLRLKDLFSSLPSSARKRYKELTHAMDQSKNFNAYRRMFTALMEPGQLSQRPAIPHLAVILKDLFQMEEVDGIDEGPAATATPAKKKDKDDKDKKVVIDPKTTRIAFHKYQKQWRILSPLLECQKLSSKYRDELRTDENVAARLLRGLNLIGNVGEGSEKEDSLWERSYDIEPKSSDNQEKLLALERKFVGKLSIRLIGRVALAKKDDIIDDIIPPTPRAAVDDPKSKSPAKKKDDKKAEKAERQLIMEGFLRRQTRSGDWKRYYFHLLSDMLMYSAVTIQNKYELHQCLRLEKVTVTNRPDTDEIKFSFQVNSPKKSFVVCAENDIDKKEWITSLTDCCEKLNAVRAGKYGNNLPVAVPPPLLPILKPPPASAYRAHHHMTPSFFASLVAGPPASPAPGAPAGGLFSWARMRSSSFMASRRSGSFLVTPSSAAAIAGVKSTSIAPVQATIVEVDSPDRSRSSTAPDVTTSPSSTTSNTTTASPSLSSVGSPSLVRQMSSPLPPRLPTSARPIVPSLIPGASTGTNTSGNNGVTTNGSDNDISSTNGNGVVMATPERRPSAKSDPSSNQSMIRSANRSSSQTLFLPVTPVTSSSLPHNSQGTSPPPQYHKMVTAPMNGSSTMLQMTRSRPGSVHRDGTVTPPTTRSGTSSKRGSLTGSGMTVASSPLPALGGRITEVVVYAPQATVPANPLATIAPSPPTPLLVTHAAAVVTTVNDASFTASYVDYGTRDFGHRRIPTTYVPSSPTSGRHIPSNITTGPTGGHALDWSPSHRLPSVPSKFPPSPSMVSAAPTPTAASSIPLPLPVTPMRTSSDAVDIVSSPPSVITLTTSPRTPAASAASSNLLSLTPMGVASPYALSSPTGMIGLISPTSGVVYHGMQSPPPLSLPAAAVPLPLPVPVSVRTPAVTPRVETIHIAPPSAPLILRPPPLPPSQLPAMEPPRVLLPFPSSAPTTGSTLSYSHSSRSGDAHAPMSISSSSSSSSYQRSHPSSSSSIVPHGWQPSGNVRVPSSLWQTNDMVAYNDMRDRMCQPPSRQPSNLSDWREQRRIKGDI